MDTKKLEMTSLPANRGVYTAERASQLSGVPKSTIYYWARTSKFVIPSVSMEKVKLWSYQDLVFLRFVAWLRANDVSPFDIRPVLERIKDSAIDLSVTTGAGRVFHSGYDPSVIVDVLNDQTALAGERFVAMLPEFRLDASEIDDFGRRQLWGPNLIEPSNGTRIHPDVLSGEPFVLGSRIPTAALFALTQRHLSESRIAELYEIDVSVAKEAIWLEKSVRAGEKLPLAA